MVLKVLLRKCGQIIAMDNLVKSILSKIDNRVTILIWDQIFEQMMSINPSKNILLESYNDLK